jgi:hypothetical protein
VLSGAANGTNFVLQLDRPVDPATVTPGNVGIHRNADSRSEPSYTVGCSNTPCTTIVVDPGSIDEGRYLVTASNLKSEEGMVLQSFAARYAVPFVEDGTESAATGALCPTGPQTTIGTTYGLNATDPNEVGSLDFDWSSSGTGGWSLQAYYGTNPIGDPVSGNQGSGHSRLTFPLGGHTTGALTLRLTAQCSNTSINLTNMLGSRVP